jgi:hypothetical protein
MTSSKIKRSSYTFSFVYLFIKFHFFYISFYISFFYFKLISFHFFHVNMKMSRFYRSTHERSNTATYVETQRRLKLITLFNVDLNVNFNVDSNSNLDLDESNSNFFFAHFVFTSFLMRIILSLEYTSLLSKIYMIKIHLATKDYLTTKIIWW